MHEATRSISRINSIERAGAFHSPGRHGVYAAHTNASHFSLRTSKLENVEELENLPLSCCWEISTKLNKTEERSEVSQSYREKSC